MFTLYLEGCEFEPKNIIFYITFDVNFRAILFWLRVVWQLSIFNTFHNAKIITFFIADFALKRFKVCAHKSESGRWKFDIVVHLRDLCNSSRCRCSAVSVVRRRLSTWRWVKAITRTLDLWLELSTKELPAVGSWWVAHQLSKELSSVLHVSIVPFTIKLQLWSETGGYWVVQCVIWLSQDLFHRVSCKCETTRNLF